MFEMNVTVFVVGVMLVASIPYMTGEIHGPVPLERQQTKSQIRLSASEYIDQMGPNTPAWKRPIKVHEASVEPLK